MTKEALAALDAAITYLYSQEEETVASTKLAIALCALRDAEAKPVESCVTPEAYETVCQRNSEWLMWARDTLGSDAGEIAGGNELRRALEHKIRRLEREAEVQANRAKSWFNWARRLSGNSDSPSVTETCNEIERLVELGRKGEDTEAKLKVCSEQFDAVMNDWGKAAELLRRIVKYADEDKAQTPGSTRLARAIEEAREMLRPAIPAQDKPTKAEAELQHLTTAGTRAAPPWKMPQTEEPEPRPLTEMERKRLMELPRKRRGPGEPLGPGEGTCDPVEPKPPELKTMLTALMPDRTRMPIYSWEWGYSTLGVLRINLGGNRICYPTTPAEALQAINARLAELAPKGWRLWLEGKALRVEGASKLAGYLWFVNADLGARIAEALAWIAEREKPAEPAPKAEPKQLTQAEVDALPDGTRIQVKWSGENGPREYILGVRCEVRYALTAHEYRDGMWPLFRRLVDVGQHPQTQVWLEKPAPDEPIKPPAGVTEKICASHVMWNTGGAAPTATKYRDGALYVYTPDGRIPQWLPQLQARAKQVLEKG